MTSTVRHCQQKWGGVGNDLNENLFDSNENEIIRDLSRAHFKIGPRVWKCVYVFPIPIFSILLILWASFMVKIWWRYEPSTYSFHRGMDGEHQI